jgi:hypothetical protein
MLWSVVALPAPMQLIFSPENFRVGHWATLDDPPAYVRFL